jgi:hypothetical protein
MTKTKTPPAASITRQSLDRLTELIAPFGWSIDPKAAREFSTSNLQMIADWSGEESDEETPAPGSLWKVIAVPYDQRKAFRDENDVRALLYTLLTYRQDFLSMAADSGRALELLADNVRMNDGHTPYGTVYLETEPIAAIWFGKKAGMVPALGGKLLIDAIAKLLQASGGRQSPDYACEW